MQAHDLGELRRLEERILEPEIRRSRERVAEIIADEFVEFGASGRLYDKSGIVEALAGEHGRGPPDHQEIMDYTARSIAAGVALALYRVVRTSPDGAVAHSLRSSLWKVIDGRWQMTFHQGTPTA